MAAKFIERRKLVVSMNITLDGYLSGPDCELDWHFNLWTTEMAETLCGHLQKADALLLGRITYMAMAQYWATRAAVKECPVEDLAFFDMMARYTKYVITGSVSLPAWQNTVLVKTPLAGSIRYLKEQEGKYIMVYGSGKLVKSILKLQLADELHLWLHPVTIGAGKPFFKNINQRFRLVSTQTFRSGVVLLIYSTAPV